MPIHAETCAKSPDPNPARLHEHDFHAWIGRLSRQGAGQARADLHGGSWHDVVLPDDGGRITESRGTPWKGASALYMDFRLRKDLQVHLEPGRELLLTLFLSGRTGGRLDDAAGRRLDFRTGRTLLRTPNRGGYLIEIPAGCRNRFVHFRLQRSRLPAWLRTLEVRLPARQMGELMDRDDGHVLCNAPPTSRVHECLARTSGCPDDPSAFAALFQARATELLTSVLLDLGTLMVSARSGHTGRDDGLAPHTVARIRNLVAANPAQKWTVEALARRIGCSGSSLQRHVREAAGSSVHRLLVDLRLEQAARLLRETRLRVHAIAAEAGWECHGRFTAAFRARYGATPRAYRLRSPGPAGPEPRGRSSRT